MEYYEDFYGDYVDWIKARLTAMGVTFDPKTDPMRIEFDYWTVVRRSVSPHPRRVVKAREFQVRPELRSGLDSLEQKFLKGMDVNMHLSNTRLKAKGKHFNDGLFNDWRIQHFHLGPNGKRGDDCLFAVVDDDIVYFLDIMEHGRYGDVDLLDRIKANGWTHLLGAEMTIKGGDALTADEIMEARAAGLTPLSPLSDGSVYYSPGGGISTAKVGTASVDRAARARDTVREWLEAFKTEGVAYIESQGLSFGGKPRFKLVGDDHGNFEIADAAGKIRLALGNLDPRSRPPVKQSAKWIPRSKKRKGKR